MTRNLFLLTLFFISLNSLAQENFNYRILESWNGKESVYTIVNINGDTIKHLDPKKYITTLNPAFNNFAVFAIKGKKGWSAIDLNENYLFQVYNRFQGEPYPDFLIEDRIRIVGEKDLIGFADSKGKIVISPQFEAVSEFNNGFAIFRSKCKKTKADPDEHVQYHLNCEKAGFIDKSGKIIEIGNYSFEEIKNKIGWSGES